MTAAIENQTPAPASPWLEPWPEEMLERVLTCPVCNSATRTLLHEHLVDNAFFVAHGQWNLYRCAQCKSAYLDPRPNQASINQAYGTYYTHAVGEPQKPENKLVGTRWLKYKLFNGYVNWRYGTRREPSSRWGVWLAQILRRHKQRLDVEFRYLPKPIPGQSILDVGCGNGEFLSNAHEAGWEVTGLDPDPQAVAAAEQRGLNVSVGSIESLNNISDSFDAITLSHVLEHVHEPRQLIQAIHRLLKPGGSVYIDTPNMGSKGARYWGRNWRGIEAPRHLVLFSLAGLVELLKASGFEQIEIKRRTVVRKFIYLSSFRMQHGKSPYGRDPAKLPLLMRLKLKYVITRAEDDEFLTLVAKKTS